jgi:hypothetical protein
MFTLIRRGRSRHALEAHTPLAVQPGDPE